MTCRMMIVGVVFLGLFPTAGHADEGAIQRYAVVVGTNRAPEETLLRPLRYADDDAARYFDLFRRTSDEAVLLTVMDQETQSRFPDAAAASRPPTRENLQTALSQMFDKIRTAKAEGVETELFFVYSGHGRLLPGIEGAVTLEDGELTRTGLYHMLLEQSPADFNHLIIDACNAYFLVHRRGANPDYQDDRSGRQRGEVAQFFEAQDMSRFPNTGVLLSTTSEAETHEWSRYQGGIFSHEIRSALLGAADVTGDGFIEYSEVEAFVRAANHLIADPAAKLDVFARPPASDQHRPLSDLLAFRATGLLDIPRGVTGRFYVEDDLGTRVADFNKSGDGPMTLALFVERTHFLREVDDGWEAAVRLSDRERSPLKHFERRPISAAAKGAVEESFRVHLFTQGFGPAFYAGMTEGRGALPARHRSRESWRPPEEGPDTTLEIAKVSLVPKPRWQKPVVWTGIGLSVGLLGGAGAMTYLAVNNAEKYRTAAVANDTYLKRRNLFLYSSIGAYVLCAAALGTALYVHTSTAREDAGAPMQAQTGGVSWRPMAGGGRGQMILGLEGTF